MENKDLKVTVLCPTLNEIEGVQAILPKIKREWYDQLIILDGGSDDGTVEWCIENGYDVFKCGTIGVWRQYKEIFQSNAITGDIIVTFSPDGNSKPEAIPLLVKALIADDYDMVIGSRYLGNARSYDDTWLTAIGNKLLTALCRFITGSDYTDALVMLRAYKKSIVKQLGFDKELNWFQRILASMSNLYGWESSMSIRAAKKKLQVAELAVSEPKALRERRQNTFVHGFVIISQILYEGGIK